LEIIVKRKLHAMCAEKNGGKRAGNGPFVGEAERLKLETERGRKRAAVRSRRIAGR
jgi:hypothetical protein